MELNQFLKEYLDWTQLIEEVDVVEPVNIVPLKESIEGLLLIGMGGSGIVGDVIYSLSSEILEIPVTLVKDFQVPKWVGRGWLAVAVSYSGDTVETLTCLNEVVRRGSQVAVVASGGEMIRFAEKMKLPYVVVPPGRTPRSSFPALLLATFKILKSFGIDLGVPQGKQLTEFLKREDPLKLGYELSERLLGKIPVFVSSTRYYPLALRAKDEFNENAKVPAKVETYPEGFHNDIVGWEAWFGLFSIVIFREKNDAVLGFLRETLLSAGLEVTTYELSNAYVQEVVKWSQIVGIASVVLATKRGLDPRETKHIRKYKEFIKQNISLTLLSLSRDRLT
ncbi:MAG: bifunctional phosphoglucose/phosphomannose isomerase [Desulfurococcaceae archaeon TW002]